MRIREANLNDVLGITNVHVESWKTTYRGILPDQFLDNLSYENRERQWKSNLSQTEREDFLYVVEIEDGKIVGFVSGGPNRDKEFNYQGELYAIYLLDDAQRKGVGYKLVQSLIHRLIDREIHSMLVWVLADNSSRNFYEALGGKRIGSKQIEIGGQNYEEIAYGWEDIKTIIHG